MLTFLRKARRRLIHENRITRYLAYALGEIILVVAGILIAIQLNTIKQNGDQQIEMDKMLTDIHRELVVDSTGLATLNEYYLNHSKNIQTLIRHREGLISMENNEIRQTLISLFFFDK